MALSIKFPPADEYGESIGPDGVTLSVVAALWNDTTLIARRMVQGFTDEVSRNAKAEQAFAGFDELTPAEVPATKPDPSTWPTTIGDPVLPAKLVEK